MQATKIQSIEDKIIYQYADCTIAEVAKQLEFCATVAHQSELTKLYTKALKAYLMDRLQYL